MAGATCPEGWCVEASPPAETARAYWLGLGWRIAADGLHATLHQLASGPWAAASSELRAPVSHFGQASAIALFWNLRGSSAFYFFKNCPAFFFSVGN